MDVDLAKAVLWLQRGGYTVTYPAADPCICLIGDARELWAGRGADTPGALRDAIDRVFPSRAAREALAVSLGALAVEPLPAPDDLLPAPTAPLEPLEPGELTEPVAPNAEPLPATTENATVEEPLDADDNGTPTGPQTVQEALAEIHGLVAQIAGDRDELALTIPRRQRLVMLGWIARARAAQERFPAESGLNKAVAGVAKTLTGYCQLWWPGSVRALQVSTRPEAILPDLPLPVDHVHHSWAAAAAVAVNQLHVIEEDDESRGRDEHGWADARKLSPPPRDPDTMLDELATQAERLGGPLGAKPSLQAMPDPPEMLDAVRKLRWIRDAVENAFRWGTLAGRYRFWIREKTHVYTEAHRALDPEYGPERSWAHALGRDPETIARRRAIHDVFARAPTGGSPEPVELSVIAAWLGRALPLADTHHADIVAAMLPFRDALKGLDASVLPGVDRRMRRRFAKLQKDVEAHAGTVVAPSIPPPALPPAAPDDPVDASAMLPPSLLAPVVERTRGRRALFVSNRADPELRDRLHTLFEFGALEWLQGESRRRQALEGSIAAGAYDFVLGATGFLSHTVDAQIGRACRKADVHYVRVHRGRPLACLRALARDLGMTDQTSTPVED